MKATIFGAEEGTDLGSRGGIAILLSVLLFVCLLSILSAVSQPFWFDEVTTILLCRLPNAGAIWSALADGADSNPPLFHLVERFSRALVGSDHLGYRLPAILGFLITASSIYFFLSRRVSRLAALAGMGFVLCSALTGFVTEARPYALMMGCVALAILSWQRIEDSKLYALATAAALAAALSLHYYAVLVWPVFCIAESSIWILKRRFRAIAWAAIMAGLMPLGFFGGLILHFRKLYEMHFWTKPSIKMALLAHDWLFNLSGHWGWTIATGLTALVLFLRCGNDLRACLLGRRSGERTGVPVEELTMTLALLWLPLIANLAAKLGHGGMSGQYMLPTILGGAFAVGYVVDEAPAAARGLLLSLFLVQYFSLSVELVHSALRGSLFAERESAVSDAGTVLGQAAEANLPLVVGDDMDYLPAVYYASPGARSRLFLIADPQAAVEFSKLGSNSAETTLDALRRHVPLQVEDYASFLSVHREFLLVARDDGEMWLMARLLHNGDSLQLISWTKQGEQLFKVTVKQ